MMPGPLDQESKLELRALRKANELFLRLLHAQREQADYVGNDDFAKSIDEAYRAIRKRMGAGGKGWEPP